MSLVGMPDQLSSFHAKSVLTTSDGPCTPSGWRRVRGSGMGMDHWVPSKSEKV